MITQQEISKNLKKLRITYGYSLTELSRFFNCPPQSIFGLEKGTCYPSLLNLLKYAEFFNLTLHEVVFFNSEKVDIHKCDKQWIVGIFARDFPLTPSQKEFITVMKRFLPCKK